MQEQFYIEEGVLIRYAGKDSIIFIPESVHTIGPGVFKGLAWITEVHLPSGLRHIGAEAFKGCGKLGDMVFPKGLTSIGAHAFQRCKQLREVILPDGLTQIGQCAFRDCDNLEHVQIRGVKQFPKELFAGAVRLKVLGIHAQARSASLKDGVLDGCLSLQQLQTSDGRVFRFPSVTDALDHPSQLVRDVAQAILHPFRICHGELKSYTGNQKDVVLPDTITAIGHGCFAWRKNITSVFCPASLRAIGLQAFAGCTSLETVEICRPGVMVAEHAFYQCRRLKGIVYSGELHTLDEAFLAGILIPDPDAVLQNFYISGKRLIKYWGSLTHVVIPDGIEVIGERCFENELHLQTVYLPVSIKRICAKAFRNCHNLKNVYSDGVQMTADPDAFEGCEQLRIPAPSIHTPPVQETSPESLHAAAIVPYAFCNRDDLTQLHLKDVPYIGDYAFAHCRNLETLEIDAPDCTISRRAFTLCSSLKQIRIHVKQIGKGAFSHCRNLERAEIKGVSALGEEVFAGCEKLRLVKLPDTVSIGKRCFDDCISLSDFDFSGITRIDERSFERCNGLKRIFLSDTTVGRHAFADCAALECIEYTASVSIDSAPFFGCTQVREICYDGIGYPVTAFADGMNYVSNPLPPEVRELISGIFSCFDITRQYAIRRYLGNASVCTIPEGIREICADAFRHVALLKHIHIPETVTKFGKRAFEGTPWLEEQRKISPVIVNRNLIDGRCCAGQVVIAQDVEAVCKLAFDENTEITSLVLKNSETRIEESAFRNCFRLKRITTADGCVYIYRRDLSAYPDHISQIFRNCTEAFEVDPEGRLIKGNGNISAQYLPEGITTIGEGVYRNSHRLEHFQMTPDTEQIEKEAFRDCKWLRSVSGTEGIRRIGESAFDGCGCLEEITLSENLKEIGPGCFRHCCNLQSITLSPSLPEIPAQAFFRCKSLRRIVLPASVKKIGPEAFALCSQLEEVVFLGNPAELEIDSTAFSWCEKLQEVTYAL